MVQNQIEYDGYVSPELILANFGNLEDMFDETYSFEKKNKGLLELSKEYLRMYGFKHITILPVSRTSSMVASEFADRRRNYLLYFNGVEVSDKLVRFPLLCELSFAVQRLVTNNFHSGAICPLTYGMDMTNEDEAMLYFERNLFRFKDKILPDYHFRYARSFSTAFVFDKVM
jgi:hypothetical protein